MLVAALSLWSCDRDPGTALADLAARVPAAELMAIVPGRAGHSGTVLLLEGARFEPAPAFTAPEPDLVEAVRVSDEASTSLGVTGVQVVDASEARMDVAFDKARAIEQAAAKRTGRFAAARDMVLAEIAVPQQRAAYAALREDALLRLVEVDAAVDGHGVAVADAAIAASLADDVPVAIVGGLDSDAIERELTAKGATFAIAVTPGRDAVGAEYQIWRTGLDAVFPAPPADSDLPTLEPWIAALAPRAAALPAWTAMPAIRAAIRSQVGPPPPILDPSSAYRRKVDAAAERLASVLAPGSVAAEAMGDPIAAIAGMDVRMGSGDLVMKYDALYDCLKVAPWFEDAPVDDIALILAHELVHAHDAAAAAARLGITGEDWAFLLDTLDPTVDDGVVLVEEDRAFRVEMQVMDLLDPPLPTPEEARAILDDDHAPRWEQEIAGEPLMREKGVGSIDWLEQIADTYMHRR